MTRRVAILGANGFIGSRLVEAWHLQGQIEVRPVVRRVDALASLSRFDLDCHVADGRDEEALRRALAGCDVVVHAIAGPPEVITGTVAAPYRAAQAAGVRRFIYLSSASVYGQAPAAGTDERSPLRPRQRLTYNLAKVKAEKTLRQLRARGNVETVILRPGIVFGPRSSWVTNFADALREGTAYLLWHGTGVCNSLYIDNLVEAIDLALDAPNVDGEAFLLRDRERITWADFYRPIAQAFGVDLATLPDAELPPRPNWRTYAHALHQSRIVQAGMNVFPRALRQAAFDALVAAMTPPASPWQVAAPARLAATEEMAHLYSCQVTLPYDKARAMLGYEPPVSFAEGCRRTVRWLAFAGYPVQEQATAWQLEEMVA